MDRQLLGVLGDLRVHSVIKNNSSVIKAVMAYIE